MFHNETVSADVDIWDALDRIGENIWEHNFLTGKTRFAKTFQFMLGYHVSEITDRAKLWWDILHPDDRHILEKNDRGYKKGEIKSHSVEYRVFHRDGSIKWILDRGTVAEWSEDGRPLRIVGMHSDITPRKTLEKKIVESEKRFNDLARNVPGVIYQWRDNYDGSYEFSYVSPKLKDYFQIDPKDMDLFVEYIHPEDLSGWRRSVDHSKNSGSSWKFEGRLLYPDKSIKWWVAEAIVAEKDDQGLLYNGILIDITEQKKMQQVLDRKKENVKKKMLQAAIDAQEIEREQISHELHDNVNQLLASSKLMLGMIGSQSHKTKDLLTQSSLNIDKAITEIRNISHGLNPNILNFVGLASAIKDLTQEINHCRTITMNFNDEKWNKNIEIGPEVELAIFRIVQAQVSNILKHSRASEATICLESEMVNFTLSITDNGKGFDINQTRKGLGLINIFNRAELFNGKVLLITQPGKGCTLLITLPQELMKAC